MNLVFYSRYSSSGQTEQSIEGQHKVCMECAESAQTILCRGKSALRC